jgi:YHS domain-containing protein
MNATWLLLMTLSHPGDAAPSSRPDSPPAVAAQPAQPTARQALEHFNVLVGAWKGTGIPEGTREERAAGTWTETITWSWQFKGDDAWLSVAFDKGKHFSNGELRYTPVKDQPSFTLALTAPDKSKLTFTGTLREKILTLDRTDGPAGENQRLVISLLHFNRHLYRLETRPAGTSVAFTRLYQVGATKEGVPFANAPKGPECIVTGGVGTIKVTYQGMEYWVCCTGCRDAFKEDPEKFIKEAASKTKKP